MGDCEEKGAATSETASTQDTSCKSNPIKTDMLTPIPASFSHTGLMLPPPGIPMFVNGADAQRGLPWIPWTPAVFIVDSRGIQLPPLGASCPTLPFPNTS